MFGEEPTGNYNRILLSNVLNGSYRKEEIYLNPLSWYVENNIFLHAGKRASGLLPRAKVVFGEDGRAEPYDKLIIATGSRPFLPTMEGITMPDGSFKPGVFVFRTLDDCREIAEYAKGKKSAAVIGGGLARDSKRRAVREFRHSQVNVVHLWQPPDAGAARRSAGAILKSVMENLGVQVLLKKNTKGDSRARSSHGFASIADDSDARSRHGRDLRRAFRQTGKSPPERVFLSSAASWSMIRCVA